MAAALIIKIVVNIASVVSLCFAIATSLRVLK